MPVIDKKEAKDLDAAFDALIAASDAQREQRLRAVFVEKLDFAPVTGAGRLNLGTWKLRVDGNDVAGPSEAVRIAQRDGVHILWIALPDPRLRARNARAALKAVEDSGLAGTYLLTLSAPGCKLWHLIWSPDPGPRRVLRRMAIAQDVPRRTIVMQLAGISFDVKAGLRKVIDDAFDVEPVTKEFFRTYRDVFEKVMSMISGTPDEESHRLFCQTLFNRLMFIYFLQQKNWLSLHGNTNYLRALYAEFDRNKTKGENFYNNRLKQLFFTMLNSASGADVSKSLKETFGDVPFLNGGLFEETDLDQTCSNAQVPDDAFGLIFDSLFDRFNFTVSESTPYDIEVAVDPEMLGKVFEELVTGRHETGSYYTPRPVVSYMCREALKGYLGHAVDGTDAGAIVKLVDEHDVSGINLTQAAHVVQALDRITVVDPACGSGAYLLGMLHELIELKQELFSQRLQRNPDELYQLKLDVIERNVYGADIDEFATNIAMLRLWLSLAIDFEGKEPKPLPNLDFKIACGDSLALHTSPDSLGLFSQPRRELVAEIWKLKSEYLRAVGPLKTQLRSSIRRAESSLGELFGSAASTRAIDWQVRFAEVFAENGGFDVVITNPPYVFGEALSHASRSYDFALMAGQFDLYWLFHEQSLGSLLGADGMHCFINSDAMLARDDTRGLRKYLLSSLREFSLSHVGTVFDGVAVSAVVLVGHRGHPPPEKYEIVEYAGGEFGLRRQVSLIAVLKDPKIRFVTSDPKNELTGKSTVGDHCVISRGEELGKSSLNRFAATTGVPSDSVGVVSGAGISRFKAPRITHVVKTASVRKSKSKYLSPKILVVKTGSEFVATVDYDSQVTLQSVYNLQLKPSSDLSCEIVCAILNSSVVNAELKRLVTAQKKLFPQMTQGNVLEVRLPSCSEMEKDKLVRLVANARAATGTEFEAVQLQINELVEAAYRRERSVKTA